MSNFKVGFIGLGNMGLLMAKTQIRNKLPLTVYDLRKEPAAEMRSLGAVVAGSSRQVAEVSDVIISMVRDETQTEEVIFGHDGVWQGIKPGSFIIISSTVSPSYCRDLYSRAKSKAVQVIDAAVSTESRNFTRGQESAVFTLMIGGDEGSVKTCWPMFETLTRNIFYMGPAGSGAAAKLVNNLAMYGNAMVARECLNLGIKAGLDFNQLVEAMRVSTGFSRGLMLVARAVRQPRPAARAGTEPVVKSLEEKDNQAAMDLAEEAGASTPVSRFMFNLDVDKTYESLEKLHI